MKSHPQLKQFLEPYDPVVQSLTLELRDFVTKLVPETNELIWDNYNAVAIAYSKSKVLKDAFCHIAVYARHVNFGFNRGSELDQQLIKLNGSGKLIRHFTVKSLDEFPKKEMEQLIWQAVARSEERNPDILKVDSVPQSLVMSISEKKVRPN